MRAGAFICRAMAAVCAIVIASERAPAQQQPWSIAQLMAALAQVRSASGQFVERKTMHVLTEPLLLSGRLAYVAPDHVEKVTLSPMPEKLVMDGDRITVVSGPNNETHTFSLAQYPQIGGLVEGIRATLAGDLTALERFYTPQLSGTPESWDLRLIPHDTDVTHFVKSMEFRGSGDRIQTINSEDADGDRSEMTITEDRRDVR